MVVMRGLLIAALVLPATLLHAGVLKCKVDGYDGDVFITTAPDTNSNDGQYGRIGISPGVGDRAMVVSDRTGATALVELNGDGTPIGLLTVQPDMRVIASRHSIDPSGKILAPSQTHGVCAQVRR